MRSLIIFVLTLLSMQALAQGGTRIEILQANALEYDDSLAPGAQRLVGNVRLKHESSIMSCDSAWLYEDQQVKAFGHVHLRQGDTLDIRGERLDYDGNTHFATMKGDVKLNDPQVTLSTDQLNYDLSVRTAYYTQGGHIVSKKQNNTLTSKRGRYHTGLKEFIFSDSVIMVHPDRRIESDTLKYRTVSGIAVFAGPTVIDQGTTRIYCTNGWYDTTTDHSELSEGARILYDEQELVGDTVRYDRNSGLGQAWGHVSMIDTANNIRVSGDYGRYNEQSDESMVTGNALLTMLVGEDSLFMHGDTLVAINDSVGNRVLHAFYGVRFFKEDMQGVCDSLVYHMADSIIFFWDEPFLWNEEEQLSGDTISLLMKNGKAHRLNIYGHAFMISEVDSTRYNQITGSTMTGYFNDSELEEIVAEGVCRTVYFAIEEKEDGTEKLMGVNRADCSKLKVRVKERSVDRIIFITQPSGTMYPISKAPEEEIHLDGAFWNGSERPLSREDIFR